MFLRLSALFLILICGANALSVSSADYMSEQNEGIPLIHSASSDATHVATMTGDVSTDGHQGDCADQHSNCHQCHLGHCNFLVGSTSRLLTPDQAFSLNLPSLVRFVSADLSGPRKPPRA